MREPDRLAMEFDAFVIQRLDKLAQPMQERVEPSQHSFLGSLLGGTGPGEQRRSAGLLDMNSAGAAHQFRLPSFQRSHASFERVIDGFDLFQHFLVGTVQLSMLDEEIDDHQAQFLNRFEVFEGWRNGNTFRLDGSGQPGR